MILRLRRDIDCFSFSDIRSTSASDLLVRSLQLRVPPSLLRCATRHYIPPLRRSLHDEPDHPRQHIRRRHRRRLRYRLGRVGGVDRGAMHAKLEAQRRNDASCFRAGSTAAVNDARRLRCGEPTTFDDVALLIGPTVNLPLSRLCFEKYFHAHKIVRAIATWSLQLCMHASSIELLQNLLLLFFFADCDPSSYILGVNIIPERRISVLLKSFVRLQPLFDI